MIRRAVLFAGAILFASPLPAQRLPEIPQVGGEQPGATASSAEAPEQISADQDSRAHEAQLSGAAASREQPKQLTTAKRSAESPDSLSRPSDGRNPRVERVEGTDRCDPALAEAKKSPDCKRVIETRADEFSQPQRAELTPEQHLLIDQQARSENGDVTDATRRLAATGDADSSPESLAIATIVLRQPAPEPGPPEKQEDPTTQAAVQALLQLITQTGSNQP